MGCELTDKRAGLFWGWGWVESNEFGFKNAVRHLPTVKMQHDRSLEKLPSSEKQQ